MAEAVSNGTMTTDKDKVAVATTNPLEFIPIPLPGQGQIVWYNDTNDYIDVQTFDEKDAWRLIAYETRRIAPKQAAQLTARGQVIHVRVANNGATYDCEKGKTYVFNGTTVLSK